MKGFTQEQMDKIAWETTVFMVDEMKKIGKYSFEDMTVIVSIFFLNNLKKIGQMYNDDEFVIRMCESLIEAEKELIEEEKNEQRISD